jgi:glycosyltransferase involved in cell wall biosynthesis
MKIAHVTATFLPYYSGTGMVCYHNAIELVRRGHQVHVFTAARGPSATELLDGIHIHRLKPIFQIGNAAFIPRLEQSLMGFNLIHLHYPFFGGEAAAFTANRIHIPLVITYHNDVLLTGAMALMEMILRQTLERYVLRSAAQLLFTSRDYAQASYIRPLLNGREDRIGELPNGVDTLKFTPGNAPSNLAEACHLSPGDRLVLLVAGLDKAHYFKGVDIFLRALAKLPAGIKGVIVGDGELRSAYMDMAQKLGLSERLTFAGRVSDQELPDYYRLADVTVLPSITMGEAFGMVLIESMACGTPVIASNLPGVRTVVSDGQDGFLVQPMDVDGLVEKLRSLLEDSNVGKEMGQRGRIKVEENYSWLKVTDRLEHHYESLMLDTIEKKART